MNATTLFNQFKNLLPDFNYTGEVEFDTTFNGHMWLEFKGSFRYDDCGAEDDYMDGTGYRDIRTSLEIWDIHMQDANEHPLPPDIVAAVAVLIEQHYE